MTHAAPEPLHAVVTAGGTSEPIDDVRVITNLSTGRLGAAVARALAASGVRVTLLASRRLAERVAHGVEALAEGVTVVPFGSFADLDAALAQACAGRVDLLFMAAAVSDYSPVPFDGKLRSDGDELTLRLRRNPKLLDTLRARCGDQAVIVGFKLLSQVSEATLIDSARGQLTRAHLDLCLANDLQELGQGSHPAWIVSPDAAERVSGSKDDTARALVAAALGRVPSSPAT